MCVIKRFGKVKKRKKNKEKDFAVLKVKSISQSFYSLALQDGLEIRKKAIASSCTDDK